jgi:hypothetical protein
MERVKILLAFTFGGLAALAFGFGGDVTTAHKSSDAVGRVAFLEGKLVEFENRARTFEDSTVGGQIGNKVVAPFEVKDGAKRVFYVDADSASVWFGKKKEAAMSASAQGGFFHGYSASGTSLALLSSTGVEVKENYHSRIMLGKDERQGNYLLSFLSGTGELVAGIGDSADTHAAVLLVFDKSGKLKGRMVVSNDGHGIVDVFGINKVPIVQLTNTQSGGGKLWIGNADGKGMVEAGDAGGYGIVRAGPDGFQFIPTPGLALPGSVIVGKR